MLMLKRLYLRDVKTIYGQQALNLALKAQNSVCLCGTITFNEQNCISFGHQTYHKKIFGPKLNMSCAPLLTTVASKIPCHFTCFDNNFDASLFQLCTFVNNVLLYICDYVSIFCSLLSFFEGAYCRV